MAQQKENQIVVALRWIAFIPGGIIAGALAGIAAALILGCASWLIGLKFETPFNTLVGSWCAGWVTVSGGAMIAPSPSKTVPAIIASVVLFVMGGGSILIRVANRDWFVVGQGLCLVVAGAVALTHFIEQDRKRNSVGNGIGSRDSTDSK